MTPINLSEKLSRIATRWDPQVVADDTSNDVMAVTIRGRSPWHTHPDTDDFFPVLDGESVTLGPGEIHVGPAGIRHRPVAPREAHLLLVGPKGTPNTDDPATAGAKPRL